MVLLKGLSLLHDKKSFIVIIFACQIRVHWLFEDASWVTFQHLSSFFNHTIVFIIIVIEPINGNIKSDYILKEKSCIKSE